MTETFSIVPANPRLLLVIAAFMVVVMGAVVGLVLISVNGARSSRFEVSDAGLRIRGDLYGRMIPASQIRGGEVRHVNLSTESELRLRRRTMGTSISGYQSGWFRLQNGDKALVYVTDPAQVVVIPTTAGYTVMLSVTEPERMVQRLQGFGAIQTPL